jgi:hypothetical protein
MAYYLTNRRLYNFHLQMHYSFLLAIIITYYYSNNIDSLPRLATIKCIHHFD